MSIALKIVAVVVTVIARLGVIGWALDRVGGFGYRIFPYREKNNNKHRRETMKKFISIIAGVMLAVGSYAQESDPPTTIASWVSGGVDYLLKHGDIGTGYGTEWSMEKEVRGVTLNYSLETSTGIHIWKFQSKLAIGHNTTFSDPVNYQHVFLAVPVYYLKTPSWIGGVLDTPKETLEAGPVVTRSAGAVLPSFASWKIQPAIGLRPEDIYNLSFNYRRIFFGVQYMLAFD